MKKLILVILAVSFFCLPAASYADEDEELETTLVKEKDYNRAAQIAARKGDEVRKIGGLYYIVPKGAKIYKQRGAHGVYNVEDPGTYLGRSLEEIELRLKTIENRQEKMEKELAVLKNNKKEPQ